MPEYFEIKKAGEDHAPTWSVLVRAAGLTAGGEGKSISAAEQEAAKKMLGLLAQRGKEDIKRVREQKE